MALTISPWQRVVLSAAALAILAYAVNSYLQGGAFFLKAVVGVVFAVAAMTPPGGDGRYFPFESRKAHIIFGIAVLCIAFLAVANLVWPRWYDRFSPMRETAPEATGVADEAFYDKYFQQKATPAPDYIYPTGLPPEPSQP